MVIIGELKAPLKHSKNNMQIFLLGQTKTGKTTLANTICHILPERNYLHYEAGYWAREEFPMKTKDDEFSQTYRNSLTQYALQKLKNNPQYSYTKYNNWLTKHKERNIIISGVRNPDDLIMMMSLSNENRFIFINANTNFKGLINDFEKGLRVIKDYLSWKQSLFNNISILEMNDLDSLDIEQLKDFLNE